MDPSIFYGSGGVIVGANAAAAGGAINGSGGVVVG